MVDAEAQTDAPTPAAVVGIEQDLLMGVRVRKSFGSRAFWGTVVGCYWVGGGLFYKISFDDGDVDIFSADEVLQDAQQAKKFPQENPQRHKDSSNPALDGYLTAMRHHCLKRKREEPVDSNALNVRHVQLWGQRLYASIYTNEKNETFIKELLKTQDGSVGEMEATGQVKVGDMILAVDKKRALGLASKDLAELIRKPKRPISLTFYRPQHSQLSQKAQAAAVAADKAQNQAATALSATATQSAPTTQPAATVSQPQLPVVSTSFTLRQPAFAQPASVAQGLAQAWTQSMNMQVPAGMTSRELLRQRILENAAARQPAYAPGFPMGGVFVPGSHGVPAPHPNQQMRRIAEMRLRGSVGQPARAVYQQRPTTAQAPPFKNNSQWNLIPGTTLPPYEQNQQARHGSGPQPQIRLRAPLAASNGAQASGFATNEPGRRTAPSQPRSQQMILSSSNQELTGDQSSAQNTSRKIPQAVTTVRTSSTSESAISAGTGSTIVDLGAIAALAEKDPAAAAMSMSFLSLPTSSDSKAGVIGAAETSHPTSFLSPNDFNEVAAMPSHQQLSPWSAKSKPKANVSLTTVVAHRRRLYLTLGVQGTLIAVTSFVSDETGQLGEVEASGRVFLGDVLVRMNDTYVTPGMTPSDVAEFVNTSPRPLKLWFERASWDILNGKA